MRSRQATPRLVYGIDHGHGMVPVPERGHHHGCDHVHRHGGGNGTSAPQVLSVRSKRRAPCAVLSARIAQAMP